MRVAVCDNSQEDRTKIKGLIEEYGRKNGQTMEIREYASGKVSFSFVGGERLLDVSNLYYVETDRHKNIFYTANASYRIYKKLDEIEQQLAPYGFVRVHRSFLVNMRYIRKISSYVLHLAVGTDKAEHTVEISVPKSRYAYVKREYAAYQERH